MSQLTLCLAFDGFTIRYAADLSVNLSVLSQIVYLYRNRLERQMVRCRFYFLAVFSLVQSVKLAHQSGENLSPG